MSKPACIALVLLFLPGSPAQFYEDKRCKCICPSVSTILNRTADYDQKLFIAYVPPSLCTCDYVILPILGTDIKGYEQEICTKCECKYEMRNTTVIFVVVLIVIWIIALLLLYMAFLKCLDPLTQLKRPTEQNSNSIDEVQNLLTNADDNED